MHQQTEVVAWAIEAGTNTAKAKAIQTISLRRSAIEIPEATKESIGASVELIEAAVVAETASGSLYL